MTEQKLKLTVKIQPDGGVVRVVGRDAWALQCLLNAGDRGCTPIHQPAPRWSHYIFKLRKAGLVVETIDEAHGGPFAGTHACPIRSPLQTEYRRSSGGSGMNDNRKLFLMNAAGVEIHGGIVTGSAITDAKGTRPLLTHIGSYRFFVDVIEKDGGRLGMWDGPSYEDAIREAGILAMDFGPVTDLVVGGAK